MLPIAGFEEGIAISLLFDGVGFEMLVVLSPYEFIKEAVDDLVGTLVCERLIMDWIDLVLL